MADTAEEVKAEVIVAESSGETATATPDVAMEVSEVSDGAEREKMLSAARQIEFYFADANLPYDKFMWTLYTKDPDHWVPVETVASFKRMREYAALGNEWVATALRLSEELEVDEAGLKVRRRTEVQEPKGQFERSVYAKGFGDEDDTLQKKLEEFFGKYGKTNAVRMRRDEEKKFKGSVFAEFADFKTVDAFLTSDPKPSWDGSDLLIMTKEAYCDMKIKEKGLSGRAANNRRDAMKHNGKGFNAFREMARAKAGSAKGGKSEEKLDIFLEFLGSKILIQQDEDGNGSVKEEDVPYVPGATLKFVGCGGDVVWAEIKDPIKAKFDGRAPYIKYSRGDDEGLVGFHKALSEAEIETVKDSIKQINGNDITWSLPDEAAEKQFQIERAQVAASGALGARSRSDRGGRGGSRGGRGGRGGRGRGGRGGGRGGGRDKGKDRNAEKSKEPGTEDTGDKRKRAVEPDGGPDVGVRGKAAPPALQTAKKVKIDSGEASPVKASA